MKRHKKDKIKNSCINKLLFKCHTQKVGFEIIERPLMKSTLYIISNLPAALDFLFTKKWKYQNVLSVAL